MPLWKITLSYDGTDFFGWQIQPGLPTIQGTLQEALRDIVGEAPLPQGSGRTDAGVHALGQVASVALAAPIPPANLQRALNARLPGAIRVLSCERDEPPFHARHSARWKTYEYRIFLRKHLADCAGDRIALAEDGPVADENCLTDSVCDPMLARFVWDCPHALNLHRLNQAAAAICGTHDFTSFAASGSLGSAEAYSPASPMPEYPASPATPCRTITTSRWQKRDGLLVYRVTGSGFLHHMVRNLVGTFILVGSGRLAAEAIPEILAARSRTAAGPTAPASGLFLVSVEY